ncbi:hypothetical protein [Couchioplanes caeruleus]|uniref:CorA-like Mg2+ transporter protein n=1 Tax=Couchioplanes caeruleus TaxID=56438 RepID=A0A3N1GQ95_9ACTN|nr:hypothetical protein [Couchioplanes caeruleus]ROP32411.1 hypothetical protein EDD30_5350 [Couchioplanes caeruleus]
MVDLHQRSESAFPASGSAADPCLHFDIQVTGPSERVRRWTCGSRLTMEKAVFAESANLDHPALGTLSTLGETADLHDVQLTTVGPVRMEVDLEPHRGPRHGTLSGTAEEQRRVVGMLARWAWGEDGTELTDLVLRAPTPDNSSDRPPLSERLREQGWDAADMWLLTSLAPRMMEHRTPWCLRAVRVVYGGAGALMVWHPIAEDHDWNPNEPLPPGKRYLVPLPECRRRHGQLTAIAGTDGTAEAGRLVQDIMQHHDWTEWQLTQRVERWERQFFALARDGAFEAHLDARHLGVALDETHQLLGMLRRINRDMARRGRLGWLPQPEVAPIEESVTSLRLEVQRRTERVETRLDQLNGSLREGWTLLSSAAGGARLQLDRETSERTQGFQNAAGLVAALVLVPGLVLSLYGAEVKGLPGMDGSFGLVAMAAYAAVGALSTFSTLRAMAYRKRMGAMLILIAGFFALVLTTVLLITLGWD